MTTGGPRGHRTPDERVLPAPRLLGLDARTEFRRDALRLLDSMREGGGRLIVDLSETTGVDSSGLNALILVRRHAVRRRQTVCLRNVSDHLRSLLILTKLDRQFELESGA